MQAREPTHPSIIATPGLDALGQSKANIKHKHTFCSAHRSTNTPFAAHIDPQIHLLQCTYIHKHTFCSGGGAGPAARDGQTLHALGSLL